MSFNSTSSWDGVEMGGVGGMHVLNESNYSFFFQMITTTYGFGVYDDNGLGDSRW